MRAARTLLLGAALFGAVGSERLRAPSVQGVTGPIEYMSVEQVAGVHSANMARNLQDAVSGQELIMGAAATSRINFSPGQTRTFSWFLVDSTLNHTLVVEDYRTGLIPALGSGNRYRMQIGAVPTSGGLGFAEPVSSTSNFQCCTGNPCTCRTYNVRWAGNAAAGWTQKQAQGYGQGASWMYFLISCANGSFDCGFRIRVFGDYTPSPTPSNTPTGSITPSNTATRTSTPSITASSSGTASNTPSNSGSDSQTASASQTPSNTATRSETATASVSGPPTPKETESGTQTGTPSFSGTGTPSQSGTPTASISLGQSGSNTGSSSGTPSNTPSISVTSTITASSTSSPSGTASVSSSWSPTISESSSNSPSASVTPSRSPPRTVTPTRTATGSLTATATPTGSPAVNLLSSDLLVALRVGDGNAVTNTASCPSYTQSCATTCPCGVTPLLGCLCSQVTTCTPLTNGCRTFIDVLNTAGTRVSTYPVTLPNNARCHLFWGAGRTREGFLARSDDNRFLTFTCYNGATAATTQKVVVRVDQTLAMSYVAYSDAYDGTTPYLRSAVVAGGNAYISGTSSGGCANSAGVRYLPFVANTQQATSPMASGRGLCGETTRMVATFAGDLYATYADTNAVGLYQLGSGYNTDDNQFGSMLPGMSNPVLQGQNPSLWGFTFESSTSVYIADSSNVATAHFYGWTLGQSGSWARSHTVKLSTVDPVYSIAGRVENLVDASQLLTPTFIVYAVSSPESDTSGIWRYNTIARTFALLRTLGTNQVYRSINFPPVFPSASSSNSPTPSITPTQTTTSTRTASNTASNTASSSQTASASGTASNTGTGTASSSQTRSNTGTRTGTPSPSGTGSQTGTPSASGTGTVTGTGTPSVTPSNSETGTQSQSAGATPSITASGSLTSSVSPSTSVSSSSTATATVSTSVSGSITPSLTASTSVTASSTGSTSMSASNTRTPTVTPTASPNVNRWTFSNLLVLRVGSGTLSTAECPGYSQTCTTTCPCGLTLGICLCTQVTTCTNNLPNGCVTYLDEINPATGLKVSELRLVPTGGQCTLSWGTGLNKEGFGSSSTDGRYITVPCYDAASTTTRTTARRTLLRIFAGGERDVTFLPAATGTMIAATTADGSAMYLSTAASSTCSADNGFKHLQWGTTTLTSLVPGRGECSNDARMPVVREGTLHGAFGDADFGGVYTIGAAGSAPTAATTAAMLPGFEDEQLRAPSPWGYAWNPLNASSLWVADDRAPSVAHLYNYAFALTSTGEWKWLNVGSHRFATTDPVFSVAGRVEGGVFFLYAVSAPARDFSQVWRLNTASRASTLVTTLQTNQAYRAVMFPPAWPSASASRTPTASMTPSRTPTASLTATQTASSSQTASVTSSASQTASITASSSETASITATPSITPSNTPSASATPPSSPSGSITGSNTASSSVTPPGTPSGSITASVTASASTTASVSLSGSTTLSSTASRTPSVTPTATVSTSRSLTPAPTVTRSRTPDPSITRSRTPDPTTTPTDTPEPSPSVGRTSSATVSSSAAATASVSASAAATATSSASATGSVSGTPSASTSLSPSAAATESRTGVPSITATKTRVPTPSSSRTRTRTKTRTKTKSKTKTRTKTKSRTKSASRKRKLME